MPKELTPREAFAGLLGELVLERCVGSRTTETPRRDLLLGIPAGERAFARRGLDALIEHGLLFEDAGNIGFTAEGREFLSYVRWAETAAPDAPMPEEHSVVDPLRMLIENEPRLAPPKTIDKLRTLPGRLETYRAARRSHRWTRVTMVVALGALAAAAFVLH